MGIPAVFIRTSLCNLHCIWCDTDYTWNWTGTRFPHLNDNRPGYQKFDKKAWTIELRADALVRHVRTFPCRNIILTGGEPMLQQQVLASFLHQLRLIDPDYRVEVETNGTLLPIAAFHEHVDQYNVSPKLENSNNPKKLREKPAVYRFFANSPKAHFKYVIAQKRDLEEVRALIDTYGIPPERVWLMPEGRTRQTLAKRRQWLVEVCKTHGYRYTDRLHIQIWGAKKGV